MRIFIGPTEVSGIGAGLARGFAELGIQADTVVSKPHPFGYDGSRDGSLNQLWRHVGFLRASASGYLPRAGFGLLHGIMKWLVLLRALFIYQAFIFLFAKTITNTRLELVLLRFLGKKVIFIYVGSDVRPSYIGAVGQSFGDSEKGVRRFVRRIARTYAKVALQERYADFVVNSPSTAQFHSRKFINWFSMGVPRYFSCETAPQSERQSGVRILHAPSKPLTKGTPHIVSAIERLRAKGHDIDLVMIQNMPNSAVLAELAKCDFIVDELYSDTPMAIFATEAAYFGKPAVVGGYFSAEAIGYMSPEDRPPSLFIMPDELESAIERLITDEPFRLELGQQARRFVMSRWEPREVARRYLRLIQGDVPDGWWFSPERVRYLYGCGVSRERMIDVVSTLLRHVGPQALQLSHNSELERAFVALTESAEVI